MNKCFLIFFSLLFVVACTDGRKAALQRSNCSPQAAQFLDKVISNQFGKATAIIDGGFQVNRDDCGGVHLLHWLVINDDFLNHASFVFMLENGANATSISPANKRSAFHETSTLEDDFYLQYLIKNFDIDVDLRSGDDRLPTALFYAVKSWKPRNIEILLTQNANPNVLNSEGRNVLAFTINNNWQAVYLLLQAGIDYRVPIFSDNRTIIWALENFSYYPPANPKNDWRERVIRFLEQKGEEIQKWEP